MFQIMALRICGGVANSVWDTNLCELSRKMDMLNGDLQLVNDASAKKESTRAREEADDSDAGYHFIAFVPIDGKVWKLDGLERQPHNLGTASRPFPVSTSQQNLCWPRKGPLGNDDWLGQAKPVIEARMAEYEEGQIEFAILSLVKDPLLTLVASLAENVRCLRALSARLGDIKPGWKGFEAEGVGSKVEGTLLGPDPSYDLSEDAINQAFIPSAAELKFRDLAAVDLLAYWQELASGQAGVRKSIKEEQQSIRSDEERAASRRHDYGPMVQAWVRMLARKQALRPLLDEMTGQ